jgi:hypothetical protein
MSLEFLCGIQNPNGKKTLPHTRRGIVLKGGPSALAASDRLTGQLRLTSEVG